jgi:hypothetical protein
MTIQLASAYRLIGEAEKARETALEALNIGVDPTDIQYMLAGNLVCVCVCVCVCVGLPCQLPHALSLL